MREKIKIATKEPNATFVAKKTLTKLYISKFYLRYGNDRLDERKDYKCSFIL